MPTKTKGKREVKTMGFKTISGPKSPVVGAALKSVLEKVFLQHRAMWKCDKMWAPSLLYQCAAENSYVSSKMLLQTIMICITFCVRLWRSAQMGF